MTMLTKARFAFEVKDVDDAGHTFRGLASTWDLDEGGDVIHKGAFTRTLDHWRAGGKKRPIPLIDQHNYGSVMTVVGKMVDAEETDVGLEAEFAMVPDDPTAEAAFRRVKGGFVTGLSIGYEAVRATPPADDTERSLGIRRHLHEVKLYENSLVIWGMNTGALADPTTAKTAAHIREMLRTGRFTDDERKELRALLDATPAGRHTDPAPSEKGLAPETRAALEQSLLALTLRRLATRRPASADPARVG